jgi:hypothetical protein
VLFSFSWKFTLLKYRNDMIVMAPTILRLIVLIIYIHLNFKMIVEKKILSNSPQGNKKQNNRRKNLKDSRAEYFPFYVTASRQLCFSVFPNSNNQIIVNNFFFSINYQTTCSFSLRFFQPCHLAARLGLPELSERPHIPCWVGSLHQQLVYII